MAEIKNIIFDIGYVLFDYRWKELLRDFGLDEKSVEEVYACITDDPEGVWTRYDRGQAKVEDVIEAFCNKYPEHAEVIAWVFHHPESMHVPKRAIWEKLHALKEKGYGIYLLSNYPEDLYQIHTKDADFMKDIDGAMVSYMIKAGKPERVIYEALCEKYHLIPEECVFFDDRAENIEAANNYGICGIQVVEEEKFIADMNNFLR